MAERSFVEEVKKLRLGSGELFRGEGILAVTKALLESGVAYVAGYQGAPISHLMDVLADARDILAEHGIRFENSASEATAAATLAASVNYPLRGAAIFKSTVGTNVASDALANLASGGVTGGALIVVGEDYGEGSSIMQERSHAFAMKSQIWLLDPRPNLPSIVQAVEQGGSYNTLLRALSQLGVADVYGNSRVPLYVMNVAYPVIDSEVLRFCEGKRAVLMVEEGQPNFIEQNIATILRQAGSTTVLHGKDTLAVAGEYTAAELLAGARTFLERYCRIEAAARPPATRTAAVILLQPM